MTEKCNDMRVGYTLAAFAVGAALGAGLAMLYAPHSGKETRELICKRARILKDAAGNAIKEAKNIAHETYEKGQEVAHEFQQDTNRSV